MVNILKRAGKSIAMRKLILLFIAFSILQSAAGTEQDSGYRGIWYFNQETKDEYVYKYSGGLGTYCSSHIPMAVYAPAVDKTFFVYGGRPADKNTLLEMVSCYDHKTGTVPRPTILMDKNTDDAHDNPVISLDDAGHVWVFASSHGTSRPSYIFRSKEPYDTAEFEQVLETNFSYPQPWHIPGKGFLFLQTYYKSGRGLNWSASPDGRTWPERRLYAHIQEGHYQVSWPCGDKVGSAFNYHPTAFQGDKAKKGLNWRTNLYYIETPDMGQSWRTAAGEIVDTPLKDPKNPALVHDYEAEGLLVYMQDIKFDKKGCPVILYLTSRGWQPGPKNAPYTWRIAHWTGDSWAIHSVTESDNNYDDGALYIESKKLWRIIGPTEPGPQAYNPGGEIAMWVSKDQGAAWTKEKTLTSGSPLNHTYVRPPLNADPGFYAFWADGHGRQPSESRLYFYDLKKNTVFRLPEKMEGDTASPEPVLAAPK